jgi:peptidoglycan/LPS O-acetylase OafA/YrhL
MVLLAYLTSLLLLPSPPIAGRHNESQALNGPAWSLMQEYLGNIAYALILRRLRTVTLWIVFAISGLALIWVANSKGSLDGGWDYPNIWMAPLRLTVSFVLGLWLYRIHDRVRMPKVGLLILSIVLVVCFQMPKFSKAGALDWNGLYDAACVLFLFPLIILCGAHSKAGAGMITSANSAAASRIRSTSRTSGSFMSLPVMRGPGIQAQQSSSSGYSLCFLSRFLLRGSS